MTGNTTTCVECPETIGVGPSGCRLVGRAIAGCAVVDSGLCAECVEGLYTNFTECVPCGDDVRRCTNTTALLCADMTTPDAAECTPTEDPNITALFMNHAVRCADFTTPDDAECVTNDDMLCVETRDGDCIMCNNATLADECTREEEWTTLASTRSPLVCRDDAFFSNGTCVACVELYGGACSVCNERGCIDCGDEHVVLDGMCRVGAFCAGTDGRLCTSCIEGSIPFNATDCAPAGDCAVYEDGTCVRCVEPRVVQPDGTCAESEDCVVHHDGVCLRCADGMYADGSGVCRCLFS